MDGPRRRVGGIRPRPSDSKTALRAYKVDLFGLAFERRSLGIDDRAGAGGLKSGRITMSFTASG